MGEIVPGSFGGFDAPFVDEIVRDTVGRHLWLLACDGKLTREVVTLAKGPRTDEDDVVLRDWLEENGVLAAEERNAMRVSNARPVYNAFGLVGYALPRHAAPSTRVGFAMDMHNFAAAIVYIAEKFDAP